MCKEILWITQNKIVEEIIENIGVPALYKDDLIQEIYMILLEYDRAKLNALIEQNQIKFFISRIITNTWFSKTSQFYKNYKKSMMLKSKTIDDIIKQENSDE